MTLRMRSAAILSALIFGAVAVSNASSVNVPFAFEADGVAFPAGQYEVSQSSNHGFISLHSKANPMKNFTWVSHPNEPSKNGDAVLSFDRTGSTAVLMSIHDSQYQTNNFSRAHGNSKNSAYQQSAGN